MKTSRLLLSACTIALACGVSLQAQAMDTLAQLVRVDPAAVWPIAVAPFGGSIYFISEGVPNTCGGLYKLVLDTATGKDKAVRVHQFIPYNTSTYAGQAGCIPVGLTVGTVNGTSVLIVTTASGGVNGNGGALLISGAASSRAASEQQVSFPSTVGSPVGAGLALVGAAIQMIVASSEGNSDGYGGLSAAALFLSKSSRVDVPAGVQVGPFSQIFAFPGGAGGNHAGSPAVQGADGNLYGTTQAGGSTTNGCPSYGCGVVYQLTPPASGKTQWHEHVIYSGGADPQQFEDFYAPVTFDAKGNVYGTAAFGGAGGQGGVFLLTKRATYPWPLTQLYSFASGDLDGAVPETAVVFDTNGNIYGSAIGGGHTAKNPYTALHGVIYELTKSTTAPWPETILESFAGGAQAGANPSSAPLLWLGNIYGTTYGGGLDTTGSKCPGGGSQDVLPGCGTVFELTPR